MTEMGIYLASDFVMLALEKVGYRLIAAFLGGISLDIDSDNRFYE